MKFSAPFYGCKDGDIYPTHFSVGDDCPPELQDAARAVGALAAETPKRKSKADDNPDA